MHQGSIIWITKTLRVIVQIELHYSSAVLVIRDLRSNRPLMNSYFRLLERDGESDPLSYRWIHFIDSGMDRLVNYLHILTNMNVRCLKVIGELKYFEQLVRLFANKHDVSAGYVGFCSYNVHQNIENIGVIIAGGCISATMKDKLEK